MTQLKQKSQKALVTGASSGIGAVYADRLAKSGYDVILVARDLARLNDVAARIGRETGRSVEVVSVDLGEKADLAKVEKMIETDSAISMVVNNAGYSSHESFIETSADAIEKMITVNITALARLSSIAAKVFAKRKSGSLINISSGVVMLPEQYNGVYGGTKAFILNFTRNIAEQLKEHGVKVQVVLPGAVLTEAWQRAGTAVDQVPKDAIMSVGDLVDAALVGFDQGEVVTIPSLENIEAWRKFEQARVEIIPQIFSGKPASRYR